MAQGYYEGYQPPHPSYREPVYPEARAAAPRPGLGRLVSLAGAALSVVLVMGVGIWSYRLMVRDVTGVPVIRALGGPMRVSDDDPGGRQQQYQGLAVNSVAAAQGTAEPQVLVLAPAPVDLAPEDRAPAAQVEITAPLAAPQVAPVAVTDMAAAPLPEAIPASVPGVARSPLPRSRPGSAAMAVAQAPLSAGAAPGSDAQAEALLQELVTRLGAPQALDVDPASLTPGTRLVQLGIYEDPIAAREAWDVLSQRFPAWLDGRGRVIEPATSGGRVFYRLRALGFADEPEARRFCTLFRAENLDCIPTLVR